MNKKVLYPVAAACLLAGGALGGTLLSANAASNSSTNTAPSAGRFHSNEGTTHEKGESAQRESDESSGKFPGHPGGRFTPNENKSHEQGENSAREKQEQQWKSQGGGPGGPGAPGAYFAPDTAPPGAQQ
jgi:hypothetical protein